MKNTKEKRKYSHLRANAWTRLDTESLSVPSWATNIVEKPLENREKPTVLLHCVADSPETDCLDTSLDTVPDLPGILPRFPDEQAADNEFYWSQLSGRDYAYLASPRATPAPCPWCRGRLHHSQHCDVLRASWQPTMPFGKHCSKPLSEVPLNYLAWLLANSTTLDTELRDAIALRIKEQSYKEVNL